MKRRLWIPCGFLFLAALGIGIWQQQTTSDQTVVPTTTTKRWDDTPKFGQMKEKTGGSSLSLSVGSKMEEKVAIPDLRVVSKPTPLPTQIQANPLPIQMIYVSNEQTDKTVVPVIPDIKLDNLVPLIAQQIQEEKQPENTSGLHIPIPTIPGQIIPEPAALSMQQKFSSSRQVQVEYEITQQGKSGIQRIEIWTKKHTVKIWKLTREVVPSDTKFVTADLSEDGTYGLKLRLISGTGRESPPPTEKDQPEITVVVDTTPPTIRLFDVQEVKGKVQIHWQATDTNLNPESIRLYWSKEGDSWKKIHKEGSVSNAGKYHWQVPEEVPAKVYLAVEAYDLAGNRGFCKSSQPVNIDMTIPQGRLTTLRAIEVLPMPREVP